MNATRYVDIGMVSAKRTAWRPSGRSSSAISGPFEMASRSPGATIVTAKTALKSGSSQHGKARRQSVACIWLVAMVCSTPSSSLKRERYQPRSLSFSVPAKAIDSRALVPAGSGSGRAKLTRSYSSSWDQVSGEDVPSTVSVACSSTRSAALQTSSSAGSSTTSAMSTVPRNVAAGRSGSRTMSYRSGCTARGRRWGLVDMAVERSGGGRNDFGH